MPYARLLLIALCTTLAFVLIATAIPTAQAQYGRGGGGRGAGGYGGGGERTELPQEAIEACEDEQVGGRLLQTYSFKSKQKEEEGRDWSYRSIFDV